MLRYVRFVSCLVVGWTCAFPHAAAADDVAKPLVELESSTLGESGSLPIPRHPERRTPTPENTLPKAAQPGCAVQPHTTSIHRRCRLYCRNT